MDRREALKIAKIFKKAVHKEFSSASIYLYGSHAYGSPNAKSDIDIAVVLPVLPEDYIISQAPLLWLISSDINTLIEPVLLQKDDDSPLYQEIITKGILLP